jgi:hypothetical protein
MLSITTPHEWSAQVSTSTALWIYQLSSGEWDQGEYRLGVTEGHFVSWGVGSKKGSLEPEPGDRIVCWWAKTGAPEYGVIGWGVIHGETYGGGIRWLPHPPTDRWSMSPLVSGELEAIVDKIRGGFKQATLFLAEDEDAMALISAIKAADG